MTTLAELSDATAATVETAGKSIVRVDARRRLSSSGIVWSADGLIVTANHAVTRAEDVTVGLPNGETVPAKVVGFDETTDILVLKVDAKDLTVPAYADTEAVKVGQLAIGAGRPGGLQASLGVVQALGGSWRTRAGGRIDAYLAADIVMYPGFSGGALVSADGRFLGMMTSAFRGSNVALPPETLRRVAGVLIEHGQVRRGFLGVAVQPVALPEPAASELDQDDGLLLTGVEEGGPAADAGLLVGDILVGLAGISVEQPDDLFAALAETEPGATAAVRLARAGHVESLDVVIGERQPASDDERRQRRHRRRRRR
jgi:S1-C subfamily serine protease